ncbi:MipA/OmpV family protein [Sphingomicrobium flavum]|uniref:MipA/OmpV family protein n=1 Tax=Sphingomicrobium flavum TaxID=1229164 RepID=UPI0021AD5F74|nr:MipA/OmpV family protein [Sphingomicrobium flavum]
MSAPLCLSALALSLALPVAAAAQDAPEGPPPGAPVPPGDNVTVGVGLAWGPDYMGSDDYRFIPGALVRGSVGGIDFQTTGLRLSAGIGSDGPVSFSAGPVIGLRLSRSGNVRDDLVDELPDRKVGVEVGAYASVAFKQVTNPYDSLSFKLEGVHDIAGAHDDWLLTPSVSFTTPISRKTLINLTASAEFVGDDFASTYFGITPEESALVPALAPYALDGGLKSYGASLLVGHSLNDNPFSGFSVFALGSYTRITGDFADSPLVAERGNPNQFFLVAGVGYSF